jgi:GR25 family glycosyltransferase involved in LPS biosynthesis
MKFQELPKFVINLESRPDRLLDIKSELEYVGWDFELFNAINRNSYMGCTLSHLEILRISEKRGYEKVMIIEDDCQFMPYCKSLLQDIESQISDIEFGVMNLAPTLNRPVNISSKYNLLLDITNLPPKPNDRLTEIFATNILIYDLKVLDAVRSIKDYAFHSGDYVLPIDEHLVKNVYPKFQSYTPILPIAPQKNSYSDVSHGMYNNFYTQTYNWNLYSPVKIHHKFMNQEINNKFKEEKKHFHYNEN